MPFDFSITSNIFYKQNRLKVFAFRIQSFLIPFAIAIVRLFAYITLECKCLNLIRIRSMAGQNTTQLLHLNANQNKKEKKKNCFKSNVWKPK